jgi:hypothetical protein
MIWLFQIYSQPVQECFLSERKQRIRENKSREREKTGTALLLRGVQWQRADRQTRTSKGLQKNAEKTGSISSFLGVFFEAPWRCAHQRAISKLFLGALKA